MATVNATAASASVTVAASSTGTRVVEATAASASITFPAQVYPPIAIYARANLIPSPFFADLI